MLVQLKCRECGHKYFRKSHIAPNSSYCSLYCMAEGKKKRSHVWTKCAFCNKDIYAYRKRVEKASTGRIFCGQQCMHSYNHPERTCIICHKKFHIKRSRIYISGAKYCSHKCNGVGSQRHWTGNSNDLFWYKDDGGYYIATARGHPLANRSNLVRQHWHNLWDFHDRAQWLINAKKRGASIHHRNGRRIDNRPENLEIRWPGKHPRGWTTDAMVRTLVEIGYKVVSPSYSREP